MSNDGYKAFTLLIIGGLLIVIHRHKHLESVIDRDALELLISASLYYSILERRPD